MIRWSDGRLARPAGRGRPALRQQRGAQHLSRALLLLAAIFALGSMAVSLDQSQSLASTPPMGWNSWNKFGCNVSEEVIRQIADVMVASGMKDAGYQYVVIDDCWQLERDGNGNIVADPKHFPSGMKALADYVHAKGLKFGLYSDAGTKTCQGRPIVFSICEWGASRPWLWANGVGNLWRTTGDIQDRWQGKKEWKPGDCCSYGMLDIVDQEVGLESFAGPGHWNDPDMLEVGNGGMTTAEYRAHFSLWAILAAP